MKRHSLFGILIVLTVAAQVEAVPPLVSGDVPTADKGTFEIYAGTLYERDSGSISREIPIVELVYGLTERMEIAFEIPYLSEHGEHGFGDAFVGPKFHFLKETDLLPGISGSFKLKLPTGNEASGLGSGEFDYDFLLRVQKTWGWFTALGNVGYTIVGEPKSGGVTERRDNVWFASFAQACQIGEKTRLLSEIYLETSAEPGEPNLFAANIGLEREISSNLVVHAAVGKSLREDDRGGPELRVYVGLRWEFDAPWKRAVK